MVKAFEIIDDDRLKLSDSQDELEFNDYTRDWVVAISLLMIVYTWSYNHVSKYLFQNERIPRDRDEKIIQRFAQHFSTLGFTLAIFFTFLLPFSMLANEILLLDPDAWYLRWLSPTMISILWTCIIYGRKFALFLFLPFSYFWLETEAPANTQQSSLSMSNSSTKNPSIQGFVNDYTRNSNYLSRLRSRWIDASTVYVLLVSTLLLLTALLTKLESTNLFKLAKFFTEGYSFLSVCVINVSAPFGFKHIFQFIHVNFLRKPIYLLRDDDIIAAEYRYDCAKRKYEKISTELNKFIMEKSYESLINLKKRKESSNIFTKLLYPVVVCGLVVLPLYSVFHVVFHIFELGFLIVKQKHEGSWCILVLSRIINWFSVEKEDVELGVYSLSLFGLPGVLLEVLMVAYIHTSACLGIYTAKSMEKLTPQKSKTTTQKMLINALIVLTISSALPKLCLTLDFVEPQFLINPVGRRKNRWLDSTIVKLILNILFAASTGLTILAFLKVNFIRIQKYVFGNKVRLNTSTDDRLSSQDSSIEFNASGDTIMSCSTTSSGFKFD